MSAPLFVSAQPAVQPLARALCASLPLSCRYCESEGASGAIMLDGAGPWVDAAAAAIDRGIGLLTVVDPSAADGGAVAGLARHADATGAKVVLSEEFAGNPAVAPFAAALDESFTVFALNGTGPDPVGVDAVLRQLRVARMLGCGEMRVADAQFGRQSAILTLSARRGGAAVLVRCSLAWTNAVHSRLAVRAYAPESLAEMTLFPGVNARPALADIAYGEGERGLPTFYETAHRQTLRALADPQCRGASLMDFAADADLARSVGAG